MTLEIKEKGSDRFYREVINVSSQYRYLLKKPNRKIKDYFKQYKALLILCAVIALLDLLSILFFGAGTVECCTLACLLLMMVLLCAVIFRLYKIKKTMLADTRTSTLTLDENGISLNKENTQEIRFGWDNIVFIRVLREGLYFAAAEQTGMMISVTRRYENELLAWVRENRPTLEIIPAK